MEEGTAKYEIRAQEVNHYQINQRYRIVIERIGSSKGTLGYKVEANGDDIAQVMTDVATLKTKANIIAGDSVEEKK